VYELKTKRFWRSQLPHWEVESGIYFITLRCAGSLPRDVNVRLREIQENLASIQPNSPQFADLQRRYFRTVEKYSDRGSGFCPFRSKACCQAVTASFDDLAVAGWTIRHYSIMPNHIHLLASTDVGATDMQEVWQRWKGRTAHRSNHLLERKGSFWQRDWFDRVSRSESETERMIRYIRNNPVAAGLVNDWQDYPWVQ